jgi:hypothetical protein
MTRVPCGWAGWSVGAPVATFGERLQAGARTADRNATETRKRSSGGQPFIKEKRSLP